MSHLAEELSRQMTLRGINQVTLAERSGISQGQISKWLRAEQTSINEEQLNLLAAALTDDTIDHATLVRAHLLDEKFGYGSELVDVTIRTERALQDRPRPRSKREQALNILATESVRDRDLADLLISLASYVEPANSSAVDSVGAAIVGAVGAAVTSTPPASAPATKYPPARRSAKKPTS